MNENEILPEVIKKTVITDIIIKSFDHGKHYPTIFRYSTSIIWPDHYREISRTYRDKYRSDALTKHQEWTVEATRVLHSYVMSGSML